MAVFRKSPLVWVVGALTVGLLSAACAQAAGAQEQQELKYYQQLTSLLKPVEMKTMTDHKAFMTPDGMVIGLQYDNMDLSKAQNLNWVAVGVPGKFTKAEQARVERDFGKGFTHFHDMKNDVHGGAPGAEGLWFKHIAVREFEAPWGKVQPGVDEKFMPTPPSQ